MLKKKAFNRIFFATVIFFISFLVYSVNETCNTDTSSVDESVKNREILYTLNDDNYISRTTIYVNKLLTLEDKIREKLEIMVEENNKNALLPSYFKPILPENTKVLDVVVCDNLVKVYFSKEFMNITEDQSEKMIEAIVYTITDENILGVEIYVENSMLKYVPHTNKHLPAILTKDIGINKEYKVSSTIDITKVVMTYYGNYNGVYYEVPVTKYLNDDREKIEIIIDELSDTNLNNSLISVLDGVKLNDYKINDDKIVLDFDRQLNKDEKNLVLKAVSANYDVNYIEFLQNGIKK